MKESTGTHTVMILALGEGLLLASHCGTQKAFNFHKVVVRFYSTISTIFQLHYGLSILHRSSEIKWKERELWSQTDLGIRIPAPTFTSCVTLGKSVYLSQFPHL